jgi:hypothetical protein
MMRREVVAREFIELRIEVRRRHNGGAQDAALVHVLAGRPAADLAVCGRAHRRLDSSLLNGTHCSHSSGTSPRAAHAPRSSSAVRQTSWPRPS